MNEALLFAHLLCLAKFDYGDHEGIGRGNTFHTVSIELLSMNTAPIAASRTSARIFGARIRRWECRG